jgi:(S)-ureidoglycine-glyoxylate aminotransferase
VYGTAMVAGMVGMGLKLFGDQSNRMNNIVAVRIPDGIDDAKARATMVADYGIEIGTSFGPMAGAFWRIGTMGYNARRDTVLMTLAALEQLLRRGGVAVTPGSGVDAALESLDG